jgi:hypothetical protein
VVVCTTPVVAATGLLFGNPRFDLPWLAAFLLDLLLSLHPSSNRGHLLPPFSHLASEQKRITTSAKEPKPKRDLTVKYGANSPTMVCSRRPHPAPLQLPRKRAWASRRGPDSLFSIGKDEQQDTAQEELRQARTDPLFFRLVF